MPRILTVVAVALMLALAAPATASTAAGTWTPPVDIASGASTGSAPRIITDPHGILVATWSGQLAGAPVIYAATSHDDGATWISPFVVSGAIVPTGYPNITVTDTGLVVIIWATGGNEVVATRSTDGGDTWSTPTFVDVDPNSMSEPRVAAGDSRVIAVWHRYQGSDNWVMASYSDDGITWSVPTAISLVGANAYEPQIDMSGTSATVVWFDYPGSGVVIRSATTVDNALSWTPSAPLSSAGSSTYAPRIARAADGTLTVAWTATTSLRTATSTDGGATWTPQLELSPAVGVSQFRVAAGTVAWMEGGSAFVSTTTNHGATWSSPLQVSAAGATVSEIDIANTNTGEITVVARYSAGAGNFVGESTSQDGGATWSTMANLSATPLPVGVDLAVSPQRGALVVWGGASIQFTARLAAAAAGPTTPTGLANGGVEPLPWAVAGLLIVAIGAGARLRRRERV